jgi:ferredoxin
MRIVGDRGACIGAGMCSLTAPGLFDQDRDEGLVVVLADRPDESQLAAAREAVALCPSQALSLVDDG